MKDPDEIMKLSLQERYEIIARCYVGVLEELGALTEAVCDAYPDGAATAPDGLRQAVERAFLVMAATVEGMKIKETYERRN